MERVSGGWLCGNLRIVADRLRPTGSVGPAVHSRAERINCPASFGSGMPSRGRAGAGRRTEADRGTACSAGDPAHCATFRQSACNGGATAGERSHGHTVGVRGRRAGRDHAVALVGRRRARHARARAVLARAVAVRSVASAGQPIGIYRQRSRRHRGGASAGPATMRRVSN